MRKLAVIVTLLSFVQIWTWILNGQTTPKQAMLVTFLSNISTSYAAECGGVTDCLDNRSTTLRANTYHSVYATGSGSWQVQIQYANTNPTGFTSCGSAATITQASNPAIAICNGYYDYIKIAISGSGSASVRVTYTGTNQLYLTSGSGGGLTLPVVVSQGGTGVVTLTSNGVLYGNGTGTVNATLAGTQYQPLQAGSGGFPAFAALHLDQSAAVTGVLPGANMTAVNLASTSAGGISGILGVAHGGTGTSSPGLAEGTGITITGSWPNQTINTSLAGTVTSVGLTMPAYFSVANSPVTGSATLAVTAATGQTSHRVVGTCGSGTSVSLCALLVADLPTGYLYSNLSGAPSLYYQTVKQDGSSMAQQPILNLISGSNITVSCANNVGGTSTDCAISSSTILSGPFPIATKTATYAVLSTDYTILCDATSAGFTTTLPASPTAGAVFNFKKIDASGNTCTLSSNSNNIDGSATLATTTQYASWMLQYTGSTWVILSKN